MRFIQLYIIAAGTSTTTCQRHPQPVPDTDQPTAALLAELKERGMLEDTLVIWGGEFGRTVYSQGELTKNNYGRDHHPRCYSVWMAGAGVKGGHVHGETDEFSYNIVKDPSTSTTSTPPRCTSSGSSTSVSPNRFQGRDYRLTDIHGEVVKGVLA